MGHTNRHISKDLLLKLGKTSLAMYQFFTPLLGAGVLQALCYSDHLLLQHLGPGGVKGSAPGAHHCNSQGCQRQESHPLPPHAMPFLFGFFGLEAMPMEADELFVGGPWHDLASPVFMMEVCFRMLGQLCAIKLPIEACLCAPILGGQCALPTHAVGKGALLRI